MPKELPIDRLVDDLARIGIAHGDVHERPEAERAALLAATEPFDSPRTPAEPDVGMLAEVFRRHPGTVVNDHPEGRFGARGRLAIDLVTDPPWDDYYGIPRRGSGPLRNGRHREK